RLDHTGRTCDLSCGRALQSFQLQGGDANAGEDANKSAPLAGMPRMPGSKPGASGGLPASRTPLSKSAVPSPASRASGIRPQPTPAASASVSVAPQKTEPAAPGKSVLPPAAKGGSVLPSSKPGVP